VDFDRTAWIAISQLPLLILFASKNNVLGMMLGVGYESVNNSLSFICFCGLTIAPAQLFSPFRG
jgi:hypothetical protein